LTRTARPPLSQRPSTTASIFPINDQTADRTVITTPGFPSIMGGAPGMVARKTYTAACVCEWKTMTSRHGPSTRKNYVCRSCFVITYLAQVPNIYHRNKHRLPLDEMTILFSSHYVGLRVPRYSWNISNNNKNLGILTHKIPNCSFLMCFVN
jgi:hypothetical protein